MQIFLKLVKLNERQFKEAETTRNRELFQSKVAELEAELGRVYIPVEPEKVGFPWVSSAITAMLVLTGFDNPAENIAFFWAIPFGWYAIAKFKSLQDYPSKVREWEGSQKINTSRGKNSNEGLAPRGLSWQRLIRRLQVAEMERFEPNRGTNEAFSESVVSMTTSSRERGRRGEVARAAVFEPQL